MSFLHNRISNKELRYRNSQDNQSRITLSFYKYFNISDPINFRNLLWTGLNAFNVLGRIYIANEGINAQISVPHNYYEVMKLYIYSVHKELYNVHMNVALENNNINSFWVLRIKVKPNIVADGIKDKNFKFINKGIYLDALTVNKMFQDNDTLFVDMRNNYEYEIGHFHNALSIPANNFREQLVLLVKFLQYQKNKKILLYCTGGIRCEKATSLMLHNGFKNIYHIKGGIIEYVRQARKQKIPVYFKGKIFVFDARMKEHVSDDVLAKCYQCSNSCDRQVNCINDKCHLLFIQCYSCSKLYKNCCSKLCMTDQYDK